MSKRIGVVLEKIMPWRDEDTLLCKVLTALAVVYILSCPFISIYMEIVKEVVPF